MIRPGARSSRVAKVEARTAGLRVQMLAHARADLHPLGAWRRRRPSARWRRAPGGSRPATRREPGVLGGLRPAASPRAADGRPAGRWRPASSQACSSGFVDAHSRAHRRTPTPAHRRAHRPAGSRAFERSSKLAHSRRACSPARARTSTGSTRVGCPSLRTSDPSIDDIDRPHGRRVGQVPRVHRVVGPRHDRPGVARQPPPRSSAASRSRRSARRHTKANRNSSSMSAPMPSVPSRTGLPKRSGRA